MTACMNSLERGDDADFITFNASACDLEMSHNLIVLSAEQVTSLELPLPL
jgi:cytosine/adenosine deaminase-related metal-dependent hydrolase